MKRDTNGNMDVKKDLKRDQNRNMKKPSFIQKNFAGRIAPLFRAKFSVPKTRCGFSLLKPSFISILLMIALLSTVAAAETYYFIVPPPNCNFQAQLANPEAVVLHETWWGTPAAAEEEITASEGIVFSEANGNPVSLTVDSETARTLKKFSDTEGKAATHAIVSKNGDIFLAMDKDRELLITQKTRCSHAGAGNIFFGVEFASINGVSGLSEEQKESISGVVDLFNENGAKKYVTHRQLTQVVGGDKTDGNSVREAFKEKGFGNLLVDDSQISSLISDASAAPVSKGEASAQAAGRKVKILHVGDSHTAGTYGRELYRLLTSEGYEVQAYGCVSAQPLHYLSGGFNCRKDWGSSINNQLSEYKTSSVEELISSFQPDVIVVSLGGNQLKGDTVYNPESINELFKKIQGKECYWVGPPWGPYATKKAFKDYFNYLEQYKGKCVVVDSLSLTDHNFCGAQRFCSGETRVHLDEYGQEGVDVAKQWAKGAFDAVTKSGIGQNVPAAAASTTAAAGESAQYNANCLNKQRCREIDEAWKIISDLAGLQKAKKVWDAVKGWVNYDDVYSKKTVLETISKQSAATCPDGMMKVKNSCMDIYEAPNVKGAKPLVMYTLPEAKAWCATKGKRLCYDDEWMEACSGTAGTQWPYGKEYISGKCVDEKTWRTYDQDKINLWPASASSAFMKNWEDQLSTARSSSSEAASHMEYMYQAEPSGSRKECTSNYGIYDLSGNVEEWTLRREPVVKEGLVFSGILRGRYWAHSNYADCTTLTEAHADLFRFYEVGFRCCADFGTAEISSTSTAKDVKQSLVAAAEEELKKWDNGKEKGDKGNNPKTKPYLTEYLQAGNCPSGYGWSWSAAFISYIVQKAVIQDFPRRCAHTQYFQAIYNGPGTCKTHPMSEVNNIRVGDIVCFCRPDKDRDKGNDCHIDYENAWGLSHCDIVTKVLGNGNVETIGGNIGDTVVRINRNLNSPNYFGFISCR